MHSVSRVSTSVKPPVGDRKTDLLKIKVSENDPGLKASATPFGFRVGGQATNSGTKPSSLKLEFDGKSAVINVRRGDTAQHIFSKLKEALPKGYEARVLQSFRNMPPEMIIGIAKKAVAKAPSRAKLKMAVDVAMGKDNWSTQKPTDEVAKSFVIKKSPSNRPGFEIKANILKSDPTKFYFERVPRPAHSGSGGPIINPPPGGFRATYFAPTTLAELGLD